MNSMMNYVLSMVIFVDEDIDSDERILLKRTLDSICRQTLRNIEIVCVSNVASASLMQMLNSYRDNLPGFSYYYDASLKVASGRNRGLNHAKGKYIIFIDNGDVLEANTLSYLYHMINSNSLDVLYFDGKKKFRRNEKYEFINKGISLFGQMVANKEYYISPSLQISNREYLISNNLFFINEEDKEDELFYFCCILAAQKVGYLQIEFIQKSECSDLYIDDKNKAEKIWGSFRNYLEMCKWLSSHDINTEHTGHVEIVMDAILRRAREMYARLNKSERLFMNMSIDQRILFKELLELPFRCETPIKVSVIVPICNVSQFIGCCIQSLLHQTLQQLEIIVVNDGSTDNSIEIVERLVNKDPRVIYINKENSGYGDSVNQGIRIAKGEYIGILEGDDVADAAMFERLYNAAISVNADIAKANFFNYYSKENRIQYYEYLYRFKYDQLLEEKDKNLLLLTAPAIWSGIYRRKFLLENGIELLPSPGASYQDTGFSFKTIICAERIVLIRDGVIYYRRDNEQSSIRDTRKVYCICDEFAEIQRFIEERCMQRYFVNFAMVKYHRYLWNLNRLDGQKKLEFQERMKMEFIEMKENGWLEQEYWNESEWESLKNICNFE